MSWFKQITQYFGVILLPSIATILLLVLAISGNGFIRVCTHIFKNIVLLAPRTPYTLTKMWKERHVVLSTNHLTFKMIALIIGFPFVVLFVLLDDYEE